MNQRELIEEHTMFLAVYQARISRARQVSKDYHGLRAPLLKEQCRVECKLNSLEREYETAYEVVVEYEAKLEATKKIISELEHGGKVYKERSPRKKPGRLNKLMKLRNKLNKLLEEDPELAELLEEE